jgi:metallo-beta-lactamase class B
MSRGLALLLAVIALAAFVAPARAQMSAMDSTKCPSCAEWLAPHAPVRIFGNVYFVGTNGITSLLITSSAGHILLDVGVPQAAPVVLAHIRELGFSVRDVKVILNTHDHFDHAGGIAAVQQATGARVMVSAPSDSVLRRGASLPSDPQFSIATAYPPVSNTHVIADGDTVRVGPLALVAHRTAGHTPGGTTWSWRSCDDTGTCLNFVYADSQTPVSADDFKFSRNTTYTTALDDFAHGAAALESLPCDVLLTPHPGASQMWERIGTPALVDQTACKRLAATAREALAKRIASERRGFR